jgi:hypothetical protein
MSKIHDKSIDTILNKIPEKNLKEIFDVAFKMAICGVQKCSTELINLKKIKIEKDNDLLKLIKKFQEGKITKEKFKIESCKIKSKYQKSEENLKFIECSLKNCNELMKKQLLLSIDNLTIKFKGNSEKLNKLKVYKKLFNKPNMKDIKQFYNDFI